MAYCGRRNRILSGIYAAGSVGHGRELGSRYLKAKLSLDAIQHMVVSRFPVVSDDPRIVPFSGITTFAEKVDAMLAKAAGEVAAVQALP